MSNKKMVYIGKHSGLSQPITEYNTMSQCGLSEQALSYANVAIAFAKRHKADVYITKTEGLRIELYLQVGTFIGSMNQMFSRLTENADGMLIMPVADDPNFSLKVIIDCDNF